MLLGGLRSPKLASKSTAGKSAQSQHSRDNSWEFLEAKDRSPSSRSLTAGQTAARDEPSPPLRATADRVGREVERFAEKLDRWYNSRKGSDAEAHEATFNLVGDLRKASESAVSRLKKLHASEQHEALKKEWWSRFETTNKVRKDRTREVNIRPKELEHLTKSRSHTTVSDLQQWQEEADTWKLFQTLIEHRTRMDDYDEKKYKADRLAQLPTQTKHTPESELWQRFIIENDVASEQYIVRKWLEETAEKTGSDIEKITTLLEERSERGPGLWSHGYVETRERIKGEKRLHSFAGPLEPRMPELPLSDGSELMTTTLDPDAMDRQRRMLELSDWYSDKCLWFTLFEMLRRGKSGDEIREWCRECNESWRAASLGTALPLEDAVTSLGGASMPALWRIMCFNAAERKSTDNHEIEVYGLLGGNIGAVEWAGSTWHDVLYAHINGLLLGQFEKFLMEQSPPRLPPDMASRPSASTMMPIQESKDLNARVIEMLTTHRISKYDARKPMQRIQGSIIANTVFDLLFAYGEALAQRAWADGATSGLLPKPTKTVEQPLEDMAGDFDALRICTHLLIIFRELFEETAKKTATRIPIYENVLAAYVDFLCLAGKPEIIPLYASLMTKKRAEMTMGRVLLSVVGGRDQVNQMRLLEQYNIDVGCVLKEHLDYAISQSPFAQDSVRNISRFQMMELSAEVRWPGQRLKFDFLGQSPDTEGEKIIWSLDWYMLVLGHWEGAFDALARVYKLFFLQGRANAAVSLSRKMSFKGICSAKTPGILGRDVDIMEDHEGSDEGVAPELRRSTRSRTGRSTAANARPLTPEQTKIHRDLLKQQCRTAYELEQLAKALKLLNHWSKVERELETLRPNVVAPGDHDKIKRNERLKKARRLFDDVRDSVEPLLHDFLTHGKDDKESAELEAIRHAYIPEILLAYNAAIHGTYSFLPRGNELAHIESMDLATVIADEENKVLADAFIKTSRMEELVRALTMSSAMMLEDYETTKRYERSNQSGKPIKKSTRKNAKSDRIWLVGAS